MAYCKYCGIESENPNVCQWCGRPLPPVPVTPAVPPPPTEPEDKIAEIEEAERQHRRGFFISCGVLLAVAATVILIRCWLYPWVIMGALFVSGILLPRFRILPPFEDAWLEVGIFVFLSLCFPAFFVFLGYIVYGMITRNLEPDIVWLLGTYFGVLLVLEIVTFIAFPARVPSNTLLMLRGTEFLGFVATAFGWIASSAVIPLDR